MNVHRIILLAASLIASQFASQYALADAFDGDFTYETAAGVIHLRIEQNDEGFVSGVMSDSVSDVRLIGKSDGAKAFGRIRSNAGPALGFSARFERSPDRLVLQIYPADSAGNAVEGTLQTLTFARDRSASDEGATTGDAGMNEGGSLSNVTINGQALTTEQVSQFERQYATRLIDGRYWYDDKCGAWGLENGPAAGFILPSLPLPGPMPATISGGGTGIFINGRELHPADRQVLIGLFGMAIPGRYWLDSYGNLGLEGGGVLVNLALAAQRAGQPTTSSPYGTVSTGSDGAMFSGTNLSTGKPTFWYSGM